MKKIWESTILVFLKIVKITPFIFIIVLFGVFLIKASTWNLDFASYYMLLEITVWPLTLVFLLGYLFKEEIKQLLGKITGLELPGGVKISTVQQKQLEGPEESTGTTAEDDEYFS